MIRFLGWLILVVAGIGAFIAPFALNRADLAVPVAVVVIAVWVTWGMSSAHYFGIRRHVVRHMGRSWKKGAVITHRVRTGERANVQAALNVLLERAVARRVQFGLVEQEYAYLTQGVTLVGRVEANPEPQPIVWDSVPRGVGREMSVARNALYLVHARSGPFCVLVSRHTIRRQHREQASLQILSATLEAARAALEELLQLAAEHSVYRGSVISVKHYDATEDDFTVQFHEVPPVERDAIVLPEAVLQVVERNIIGFLRNAAALRRAGQDVRHGVLLYGAPGTGKTLVTRYLASHCGSTTVILLSGRQYAYLRSACQLARLLAPCLVILEDVDLIAADRRRNRHAPLLHELMDEMDGLGPKAECTFLLTTNRPEVLEPALAARPGRVDQAVCFPLPDLDCRTRLLAQFGKGLDLAAIDQNAVLARTEGASPAFLKELFRRAALMAVERGEGSSPLRLTSHDVDQALRELVEFGGDLTRSFLGFPANPGSNPAITDRATTR